MTTAAYTRDVDPVPMLLDGRMRVDDVEALPAGTVLAYSPHYTPIPVELVGVERLDQRYARAGRPAQRNVRRVRVRRLIGSQAGQTELVEARELRGRWEPFMDRCRAEHTARQPLQDAHLALATAVTAAGLTGTVTERMYADHAHDQVLLDLAPAEAQRLAAMLTARKAMEEASGG